MEKDKIGSFLSILRKAKGLTQQDLADIFYVSNKTVSKWECGEAIPEINLLVSLAKFYEITVDEILQGERNIKNKESFEVKKELTNDYILNKNMNNIKIVFISTIAFMIFAVLLKLCVGYSTYNGTLAGWLGIIFCALGLFSYIIITSYLKMKYNLIEINSSIKKILKFNLIIETLAFFICLINSFVMIIYSSPNYIIRFDIYIRYIFIIDLIMILIIFMIFSLNKSLLPDNISNSLKPLFKFLNFIFNKRYYISYCFIILCLVNLFSVTLFKVNEANYNLFDLLFLNNFNKISGDIQGIIPISYYFILISILVSMIYSIIKNKSLIYVYFILSIFITFNYTFIAYMNKYKSVILNETNLNFSLFTSYILLAIILFMLIFKTVKLFQIHKSSNGNFLLLIKKNKSKIFLLLFCVSIFATYALPIAYKTMENSIWKNYIFVELANISSKEINMNLFLTPLQLIFIVSINCLIIFTLYFFKKENSIIIILSSILLLINLVSLAIISNVAKELFIVLVIVVLFYIILIVLELILPVKEENIND